MADPSLALENLTGEEQNGLLVSMYEILAIHDRITCPADLHQHYVNGQLHNGWAFGTEFNYQAKVSPLLCEYEQLPDKLKAFVTHQKLVLDGLYIALNRKGGE